MSKTHHAVLAFMLILLLVVPGAQAQDPPQELYWAVEHFNNLLGTSYTVGGDLWWSYVLANADTAALGCPLLDSGTSLGRTVEVYVFEITIDSGTYEYRVATGDRSIAPVPCNDYLLGLASGAQSAPPQPVPQDQCLEARAKPAAQVPVREGAGADTRHIATIYDNLNYAIWNQQEVNGEMWYKIAPGWIVGREVDVFTSDCSNHYNLTQSSGLPCGKVTVVGINEMNVHDLQQEGHPIVAVIYQNVSFTVYEYGGDWWRIGPSWWVPDSENLSPGQCGDVQPGAAQPAPAATGTCRVTRSADDVANLRQSPSLEAPRVDFICPGESLPVSGQSGQWLLTPRGWVKNDIVQRSGDCTAVPASSYQVPLKGSATCPPMPARLAVGGYGRAASGDTLSLRTQPSGAASGSAHIVNIPSGGQFTVLEGPVCDEQAGLAWWKVDYDGSVGWIAQGAPPCNKYWVEPVGGEAAAPQPVSPGSALPSARQTLNAANAVNLSFLARVTPAGGQAGPYHEADWSPDGSRLALSNAAGTNLHEVPSLLVDSTASLLLPGHDLTFSPDGRYLAMVSLEDDDTRGRVIRYDLSNYGEPEVLTEPDKEVRDIAYSPDSTYLAVATGSVYAPTDDTSLWLLGAFDATQVPHTAAVLSVEFNADGTLIGTRDMEAAHIWDAAATTEVISVPLKEGEVAYGDIVFHPTDPKVFAFTDGMNVRVVNLNTNVEWTIPSPDPQRLFCALIDFSSDGDLIGILSVPGPGDAGTPQSTLTVHTTDGTQLLYEVDNKNDMNFSPDGTLLATIDLEGGALELYGVRGGY